jgi:hypothetical protein
MFSSTTIHLSLPMGNVVNVNVLQTEAAVDVISTPPSYQDTEMLDNEMVSDEPESKIPSLDVTMT